MTATETNEGVVGQLVAKLGLMVSIGEQQTKETRKMSRKLDAFRAMQPVDFRAQGSAVADAGGIAVIQFTPSGPDQGHKWELQNLIIGGVTWATVAAGAAEVYVSAMDFRLLRDASPPLTDLVDASANALPLPAQYGRGDITIRNGEKLYVRLTGATNGQTYVASARGLDIQESATQQVTEV